MGIQMNDDLIYKVADAFKTDMFHVGSDVRGLIPGHEFKVGQWTCKSDVTIIFDENTDHMVSALGRILGNLWVYFMATKNGQWALFFDGSHVKLRVGSEKEFGLGNAKNSLKKLKPAITRVFQMVEPAAEGMGKHWEPMPLSITDSL